MQCLPVGDGTRDYNRFGGDRTCSSVGSSCCSRECDFLRRARPTAREAPPRSGRRAQQCLIAALA
eukprot:5910250-Alexandrium_andersonii.AAC.1